ncbi:MAG: hypothetical protein KTR23_09240 [Rhodospirillales bacterium]|nr:hypothetical protein [Rhodospirillales bacterium]
MGRVTEERFRIANVAGLAVLVGLACALYVGFVVTLFAGFTADIQRDLLSRELGASSPGSLERLILQGHYEADLRRSLRDVRNRIREIDTHALDASRRGFSLRTDAITAWWASFDSYSKFGRTVVNNKPAFKPGFTEEYIRAINAAYLFVSSLEAPVATQTETEVPFQNGDDANTGARAARETRPILKLDVPLSEDVVDEQRRTEGIQIMAQLHALLENPEFAPDVAPDFAKQVQAQLDDLRTAIMDFDQKSTRAQIEWANIRAEQNQARQLRNSLQVEFNELKNRIKQLESDGQQGGLSLVSMFEHPIGRLMSYLIQLPTIMLTLLVTVAAGGLGAVVAFTRQNFGKPAYHRIPQAPALAGGNDEPLLPGTDTQTDIEPNDDGRGRHGGSWASAARLLIMAGEGIAAAMAIFLFSEAGMLMLTQGGPDGSGQVDISPYLVTFMAFVSGFMAEDAFNRIQLAGKKLFNTQPGDKGNIGPGEPGL